MCLPGTASDAQTTTLPRDGEFAVRSTAVAEGTGSDVTPPAGMRYGVPRSVRIAPDVRRRPGVAPSVDITADRRGDMNEDKAFDMLDEQFQ